MQVYILLDCYVIRQSERHVCMPQIVRMWWRVACHSPSAQGGRTAVANSSAQQWQFFTHEEWLPLPPWQNRTSPETNVPYCSYPSPLPSKYLTSFHSLLYLSSVDSLSCITQQTLLHLLGCQAGSGSSRGRSFILRSFMRQIGDAHRRVSVRPSAWLTCPRRMLLERLIDTRPYLFSL
jgi:hypothetical protein